MPNYERIFKFNPYHDNKGKFAPKNGVGGSSPTSGGASTGAGSGVDRSSPGFDGNLADYAAKFDDPNVTSESVLSKFDPKVKAEIERLVQKNNEATPTDKEYSDGKGNYHPERQKLHDKILDEMFSEAHVAAATPAAGEAPTFVVLGGRGGSGKSAFTEKLNKKTGQPNPNYVKEFDADKMIHMDADWIKGRLKPPYEGWNAAQVHEESSFVLDRAIARAKDRGLSLMIDGTLKSKNMEKNIKEFKDAGYNVEGHYMHLPRQMAAERAVKRFLGSDGQMKGRMVPVEVILGNTKNEANFDSFKPYFSRWSVYDNSGRAPKFVQRSK